MTEHIGIRWQCRRCGRFVPESAVQSEDYRDPGAYYGVSSRMWVDCPRCGVVDNPGVVLLGDDGPPDDGHRCEVITDADGEVVAVARMSPDADERTRTALAEVVAATRRLMEARDAADPSRVVRREAAQARNRERLRRLGGGNAR